MEKLRFNSQLFIFQLGFIYSEIWEDQFTPKQTNPELL